MNPTFTMSVNDATNLVHAMRPKVVYPYHYRESGTVTNGVTFKQRLSADLGIEVRLRRWY
jgi:L-ascorbate metabolism protein UlaG (beta-lactamase superfamily)